MILNKQLNYFIKVLCEQKELDSMELNYMELMVIWWIIFFEMVLIKEQMNMVVLLKIEVDFVWKL